MSEVPLQTHTSCRVRRTAGERVGKRERDMERERERERHTLWQGAAHFASWGDQAPG